MLQNLLDAPEEITHPEIENSNHESKWDQNLMASFSNTKMEVWNNDDIIHWMTSVDNVSDEDYRRIVAEIKDCACTGEDIMTLESAQDFADAFGIENNTSCQALFQSMALFKAKSEWQMIPIEQWSNKNVLNWINSLQINQQYKSIMITTVTDIACSGDDIACLEAEDVGEAFQIDNPIICSELFVTIQSMKSIATNDNINSNINQIVSENNINNNQISTAQFCVGQVIECCAANNVDKWYGAKIKKVETSQILVGLFAFIPDQWITEQQYNIRIRDPKTKRPFSFVAADADATQVQSSVSDHDNHAIIITTPAETASDPPVSAPAPAPDPSSVSDDEKYVSEINYSWKQKKMRIWTNKEILDWIKCMNLSTQWTNKILNVVEMNECTGEDIVDLNTVDDVSDAFEIENNNEICQKILTEINNLKGTDDTVRINVVYKNENIILDAEFVKTDMVWEIKTRFKMQRRLDFEIKHIHFRYKKRELSDNKTLEQYGIQGDNNLIEVILDNVFCVCIFAQGNNLTLDEKVTKHYKIQKIKEMYKKQSSVHANINDIHFYKKNKALQANKTLAECGIVDDKHLITVKFATDGGKE